MTVTAPSGRSGGLLERLSDRLNPVLVKEVRQALRGNWFRWTFWVTLSGATTLAIVKLAIDSTGTPNGQEFFLMMFACLAVAAHALVPFSAFVAMGAEWEENTYDLLVLSNLKPRQIVIGKLLSSLTQGLLFYSAFGPFLAFAFLLQGVDLLAVGFLLTLSLLFCLCASTFAVALSTLSSKRYIRTLLQAVLAVALGSATMASIGIAGSLSARPQELRNEEFLVISGLMTALALWITSFAFAGAVGRLGHPEENHSTLPRLLTWIGVAGCAAAMFGMSTLSVGPDDGEAAMIFFCFALLVTFVASMVFASEPDRLGRRVRLTVPTSRPRALLAIPFLPGGGRGVLFFLLTGLVLAATCTLGRLFFAGVSLEDAILEKEAFAMLVLVAYGFVYLTLPYILFPRARRSSGVMRLLTAVLFVGGIVLPTAVAFFVDLGLGAESGMIGSRVARTQHAGNPIWVMESIFDDDLGGVDVLVVLPLVVITCLVLSARRLGRAQGEVLSESARNRALASSAERS